MKQARVGRTLLSAAVELDLRGSQQKSVCQLVNDRKATRPESTRPNQPHQNQLQKRRTGVSAPHGLSILKPKRTVS